MIRRFLYSVYILLIVLDVLGQVLIKAPIWVLLGGRFSNILPPSEYLTISALTGRAVSNGFKIALVFEGFIDFLFQSKGHCQRAWYDAKKYLNTSNGEDVSNEKNRSSSTSTEDNTKDPREEG